MSEPVATVVTVRDLARNTADAAERLATACQKLARLYKRRTYRGGGDLADDAMVDHNRNLVASLDTLAATVSAAVRELEAVE